MRHKNEECREKAELVGVRFGFYRLEIF